MIVDSFDYIACYKGLHPNLDKAIDWLNSHTLDALENGKTIIDGENVFVNVMDADLRDADGAAFEYHRRYADLQIDLTGGEGWGYETAPGTEVEPYQPDIGKKDSEDAVFGALGEGRFVLFFPGELHRPGVEMPGCDRVRKAVVKIKMEDKYHG
jgi:YhcH/YjgK/YiaL family protein